jgi:hypothetical protein
MPDNPDVLQGYIQGLLHFLSDESKKHRMDAAVRDLYARGIDSRTPSLRGLVAGSTPHDSAINLAFNRSNGSANGQENIRITSNSMISDLRRDSTYMPQGSVKDAANAQALVDAAAYASRSYNVSGMQYQGSTGFSSDKTMSGRQGAYQIGEMEAGKSYKDPVMTTRVDPSLSVGGFRTFSGAQLQNRGYGTPLSLQRFYPTPKEMSPGSIGAGDNVSTLRLLANHRLSGLDGAMDDLADLVMDTHMDDKRISTGTTCADAPMAVEVEEVTASCFGPTGIKGKQKAMSPPKKAAGDGRNNTVMSPPHPPSSPKKSGEHSPAKVKLEQVTNKFKRPKKDDPRTMSPEDKMKRSEKWRQRFQHLKRTEIEEIEEHRRNTRS